MKSRGAARLALALGALAAFDAAADGRGDVAGRGPPAAVPAPAPRERAYWLVLEGEPAAAAWAAAHRGPRALGGALGPAAQARRRLAEIDAQQSRIRAHAEQLGARSVGGVRRLANALQVVAAPGALGALRRIPGVRRVEPVRLARPLISRGVPRIGAQAAWDGTTAVHGEGVRIGVIDTGLDYTHADFGAPGDPSDYAANDRTVIEPGTFPTERVVGGWDFAGDAYDAESPGTALPAPDPDPIDCGGHGTHVSGIAAGGGVRSNGQPFSGAYTQSLNLDTFRVAPGVAPRASLFALKVFGCGGSTGLVALALDWAADPDQDADFSDRLDVINMSLGAGYALGESVEAEAVERLHALGTVIVGAAGNDGDGGRPFFSAGAPASYVPVISVAATQNFANGFQALTVDEPEAIAGDYPASEADFAPSLSSTGVVKGTLAFAQPSDGCAPLENGADVAGRIALVDRGTCPFRDKFASAEAAGAIAVVIADHEELDVPRPMGGGGGFVGIPGVLVRKKDGEALKSALPDGVSITLGQSLYPIAQGPDYIVGFSSRGPEALLGLLKPDLSAPGSPIQSAGVGSGDQAAFQGGTSQASPFVAGCAALVRQAHPDWPPALVKAALMNSTSPVSDLDGRSFPPSLMGAGRVQVDRALALPVTAAVAEPDAAVGVSFGAVTLAQVTTVSRRIVLRSHSTEDVTLSASVEPARDLDGVVVAARPASLVVPAGGSAELDLALTVDPHALGEPGPDPTTPATILDTARHYLVEASGVLRFEGAADGLGLPYHAALRAGAEHAAGEPTGCEPQGDEARITIPLVGVSAHPRAATSVLSLVAGGPNGAPELHPDVLAVGVATDLTTAPSFAEATAFIGVALRQAWQTPAQGELSQVQAWISPAADPSQSWLLVARAEAETSDGFVFPADVLQAALVDATSYETRSYTGPLNAVARDVLDTQPFHNQVVLLPVRLGDVGVEPGSGGFDLTLVPGSIEPTDPPEPIRVDPEALVVETARGIEATPVFAGATIEVAAPADAAALPPLLLLHHSNVAGRRVEVVQLPPPEEIRFERGNLALSAEAPETAASGERVAVRLRLANQGAVARAGVTLDATLEGASDARVLSTHGTCTAGGEVRCELGALSPGATAIVTLDVLVPVGSDALLLDAQATTALGCEQETGDDSLELRLEAAPRVPDGAVAPAGGCGCRTARTPGAPLGALLGAGAAIGWLRRRRSYLG